MDSVSFSSAAAIEFAGLKFRISGLTDLQGQAFRERFSSPGKSVDDSAVRAIRIQVALADFRSPDLALLLAPNGEYMPIVEHSEEGVLVQGHDFVGRIQSAPVLAGNLFVRCAEDLTYPVIENFLRILTAYEVLERGGLFLHSASVAFEDKATLFLGRSGAGKSTISRLALASGARVLSDDANILLPSATGDFEVAQVPFSGELGQSSNSASGPVEVSRIFWLDRNSVPGVRPMDPALQIARLMACASVANVDPEKFDLLQRVIDRILGRLPMYSLGFDRDSNFMHLHAMMARAGL